MLVLGISGVPGLLLFIIFLLFGFSQFLFFYARVVNYLL